MARGDVRIRYLLIAAACAVPLSWWGCSERSLPGHTPAAAVAVNTANAAQNGAGGQGGFAGAGGLGGAGGAGGYGPSNVGALGVALTDIVLHQGPARPILIDRTPVDSGPTIVAGRPGLLRIYYDTDNKYDDGEVTVWLSIGEDYQVNQQLSLSNIPSSEAELDSTINFDIPANVLAADAAISVSIEQPGSDDNPEARFPEQGEGLLPPMVPGPTLRVVVVPVRYDADGSQRLPDTSQSHLDSYRDLLFSMLPVAAIDLSLTDPMPYSAVVLATIPLTYQDLRDTVAQQRQLDAADDDVFYFGIVEPSADQQLYCANGCTVGSSYITTPADTYSRVAVALGWSDFDRAIVHELGHTLGRTHPGCDVVSDDPSYPYVNATIGVYSFDILTNEMHPPSDHSIMSYCQPAFVSDYGWDLWSQRLQQVYPQ